MYAVIRTGGKQYRVAPNQVVTIERLPGDAGGTVRFDEVLMLGGEAPVLGAPLVAGASVTGTVLEQMRGPKIIIFKKRRRKNYRRRTGHRQDLTVVRITDIATAGAVAGDIATAGAVAGDIAVAGAAGSEITAA